MNDRAPLSERIRPGSEAAPWVCEEIKKLEQQVAQQSGKLRTASAAWAKWYAARLDRIKNEPDNEEDYTGYEQDLFEALTPVPRSYPDPPYERFRAQGRPMTEVRARYGYTVYVVPMPQGMRLGIVNRYGDETSLMLTLEQFKLLWIEPRDPYTPPNMGP